MSEARKRNVALASGAALALGALGGAAEAATFEVSTLDDAGPGSLRQAILDANAVAGADIVTFQTGLSGTITLTSGQLSIEDSVDVQGPGSGLLAVNGDNSSRIFYLYNPSAVLDVSISGLTLTGGRATNGGALVDWGESLTLDDVTVTGNTASVRGGGIEVLSPDTPGTFTVTIRDSVISGNTTTNGGGLSLYLDEEGSTGLVVIQDTVISGNNASESGAGIHIPLLHGQVRVETSTITGNDAGGTGGGIGIGTLYDGSALEVRGTTISGNTADQGGGLGADAVHGTIELLNSTISGNQAAGANGRGGGVFVGYLYGQLLSRHTTIAGNTAAEGGGIYVELGTADLDEAIVADNSAAAGADLAGGSDARFEISNSLVESPGSANIDDQGGNIFNQDPQLGPLQNNGGSTHTHLPAAASPVIDAGEAATVPTDQRGFSRPVGAAVDLGAVELNPGILQLTVSDYSVREDAGTLTVTVTRTGGTDGAVSVFYSTSPITAAGSVDYQDTSGFLNWASGDASPKTFQVPLIDDSLVEGDETFAIVLTNGTGATVTIVDDDALSQSAVEIPTLGDVGQILLGGLVGAAGFLRLRRRKDAEGPRT